jgi:hypothetical protein
MILNILIESIRFFEKNNSKFAVLNKLSLNTIA